MEKRKENRDPVPHLSTKFPFDQQNLQVNNDADRFYKSLRELKGLRSQLHSAAEHCEATFSKAKQKKLVVDNTKSYVCEAIVTVIDHLGNVSANLEHRIGGNVEVSQTEQRIDCLKQRLLTCQLYAFGVDLSTVRWSAKFPRLHQHYISPLTQTLEKSNEVLRDDATDSKASKAPCKNDELVVAGGFQKVDAGSSFDPTNTHLNSGVELFTVFPSRLPNPCNPSFGFQAKDTRKPGGGDRKKKAAQTNTFLSFLGRSKRST